MKGKLVVFEGIDGVGKTTICHLLRDALWREKQIRAVIFEDVEDLKSGFNSIKPFVKKHVPIQGSLLFYLSSAIYKSVFIKKLLRTSWVICDRYVYSTLAYHRVKGADTKFVDWQRVPIVMPDYAFLIIVADKNRLRRVKMRKESTPKDLMRKTKRNHFGRMENELKSFHLKEINNDNEIKSALQEIWRTLFGSKSP